MNKILENYSIDTLIDNAYDMCDENPSISELQEAITQDIIGSPDVSFSDEDIDEVLDMTYKILKKSEEGDITMELTTTIKEQAAAAVEFALSNLYEAAIEGTYQCLEMEGVKTEDFTYEQQQSIERIVMELIDDRS